MQLSYYLPKNWISIFYLNFWVFHCLDKKLGKPVSQLTNKGLEEFIIRKNLYVLEKVYHL